MLAFHDALDLLVAYENQEKEFGGTWMSRGTKLHGQNRICLF